jgi:hypothetical protein
MTATIIDVRLRAVWVSEVGYRYDVLLGAEIIVQRSRDPEHDAARALLALGYRGRFRTVDFVTDGPRMIHDIEKAAKQRVVERDDGRIVVLRYRPMSEAVRARFGAHTSAGGSAAPPDGPVSTHEPAEAAGSETCAVPQRIPEPA